MSTIEEIKDKVPPHNSDAERAVLGAILLGTCGRDGDRVMDICMTNGVTEDTFFDVANREIYATMLKMARQSITLDLISLKEALQVAGRYDALGGAAYLQSLVDNVPSTSNAEYYISLIRAKQLRRSLINRSMKTIANCYDEAHNPDEQAVLGEAEKDILEIGIHGPAALSWRDAVMMSYSRIDQLLNSKGKELEGLSTGLKHLDEKLRGLKPSEMIVIAARPSVGKTSLAMNIAESCALGVGMDDLPIAADGGKKHPVMVFSLEMPTEALAKRMISGRAHVNMWRANRGMIPGDSEAKQAINDQLLKACDELAKAPLIVDDTPALDVMDLRSRARRAKKAFGIELIVIDYLQLCVCNAAARQASRQIEVSMISQQIKAMAKELKIPVIVLSQLSRANEQRGDKNERPKLSDLRDSGAIEQDADVVFLLRRPSRTPGAQDSNDETLAIIDVAKNRNGETGEVRVNFFREFTRFGDRDIPPNVDKYETSEPPPTQSEFVVDPNS